MGALANIRTIQRLTAEDMSQHGGDIAILKMDILGVDTRPELRSQMSDVLGYLPPIDLDALRALPEGTFGRAYATFLDSHGLHALELSDAVDPEMRARNAYGIRYMATHDMFHVLAGFGPDWVGEMGVLALTCGQNYNTTLWFQAATAWLVYPALSGFRLGALKHAWQRGLAMGQRAPFLLGVRWEDRFADNLDELRREFNLLDA